MKYTHFILILLLTCSTILSALRTSLVIPCSWKHVKYLAELLDIYHQQTVLPDEVIIVISESEQVDPATITQLCALKMNFPVKIITTPDVKFAGENRTLGCSHASGDLFILQDADDIPHPQRIEIIKYMFEKYPIDHLIHTYIPGALTINMLFDIAQIPIKYIKTNYELTDHLHHGNIAIKKSVFEKIRWSNKPRGQDVEFNRKVQALFKSAVIDASLVIYRPELSTTNILQNLAPICTIPTPQSILEHKEDFHYLYVGNRIRYSTCTGSAWFHDSYLAVLNLFGGTISTYYFDKKSQTFQLIQHISNQDGALLFHPENIAVSPDNSLLAICSDSPYPGIRLYSIDSISHKIDPVPILSQSATMLVHNIRFNYDGTYLGWASFDSKESLCIFQVLHKNNQIKLKKLYAQKNHDNTLKAKGIYFTKNNQFVISAYACPLGLGKTDIQNLKSRCVCQKFDANTGTLGPIVSSITIAKACMEDICLIQNDTKIIASDQLMDRLIVFSFNPTTGHIDEHYNTVTGSQTKLSFPHGLSVSPDNNYLAVSNYGDDKLNVYQLS